MTRRCRGGSPKQLSGSSISLRANTSTGNLDQVKVCMMKGCVTRRGCMMKV